MLRSEIGGWRLRFEDKQLGCLLKIKNLLVSLVQEKNINFENEAKKVQQQF